MQDCFGKKNEDVGTKKINPQITRMNGWMETPTIPKRPWLQLPQLLPLLPWSAQSREQLIARIKWAVKQIDPEIITKMFDHLPSKIRRAQENGLDSVL